MPVRPPAESLLMLRTRTAQSKTMALLLATASAFTIFAASAALTKSATATSTVGAAKADFVATPTGVGYTTGYEMTSAEDLSYSQKLTIDIPDDTNSGDLIETFWLNFSSVSSNTCADVAHPQVPVMGQVYNPETGMVEEAVVGYEDYVCARGDASLTDGVSRVVVIACPGGTVTGAPGNYSCSTGNWVVVNNPQSVQSASFAIYPEYVGANAATLLRGGSVGNPTARTFADNQTIEMVACFGITGLTGLDNPLDYRNLTLDAQLEWDDSYRPGVTREQPRIFAQATTVPGWTTTGCAEALTRPSDGWHPHAPFFTPPDPNPQ